MPLQGILRGSTGAKIPKGRYSRGGTLQILYKRAGGRQKESGVDTVSSRWVWAKLIGADGKCVKVYTVFRSCRPPANVGDNTWYSIQVNSLSRNSDPLSSDPRAAFLRDLTLVVEDDLQKGILPIIMMESNSPASDPKILDFASSLDLLDPLIGGQWKNTPTFDRDTSRLDLILVHRDIMSAVKSAKIVPSNLYKDTDHSTVLLCFNEENLFGNEQGTISSRRGIFLKSKNRKKTDAYIEKVRPSVERRNTHSRLNKLLGIPPSQLTESNEREFNSVDEQVTSIMIEDEQKLAHHNVQHQ